MSKMMTQLTISNAILQGQVNARAEVAPATSHARTPEFSGQYDSLDFGKTFDRYIYYEGRAPVIEGDNCFDLKPETLGDFLRMLDKKATDQGWNYTSSAQQIGIFNITHNGDPTTISITKEHGRIEMAALRSQCERFMVGEDSQHRANQNNQMMAECIWGLLTLRAQQRIAQYEDEYTFNGLFCGPLLLKIIIRTVTGNSRVTISAIRSRMNGIDAYAAEVEGNVEMITEFFTEHLGQLKAYGASLDSPMDILFKGLLAVPCEEFRRYIRDKEDMYYDESLTLTPEELIRMAQQRYMLMKTKGTFSNSITSRNEIIELRDELNQIRALAKNIPQVTNDKSSDEVLALQSGRRAGNYTH
jgi:hypothetical protein